MPAKKPTAPPPPETRPKRDLTARFARGPIAVSTVMERVTRPVLGKRGFAGAEILAHWTTIVGPELAAFAVPLQVKYPRGRNASATLVLRVASGAAATMLQFKAPVLMSRVNQFFGYEAVTQIQATQGPLPRVAKAPPPEPIPEPGAEVTQLVAQIPSPTLQAALLKLGAAVQHSRGRRVVAGADYTHRVLAKGPHENKF